MKLRHKITLIVALLTAAAIVLCSGFLIVYSAKNNIQLSVSHTKSSQAVRETAWQTAMEQHAGTESSRIVLRSMARYFASLYSDSNTIVMSGKDSIFNVTSWDPTEYLQPDSEKQEYRIAAIEGRKILFVGTACTVNGQLFSFYEAADITAVYAVIRNMLFWFGLLDVFVVLLASFLSVFFLREILNPLDELYRSASQIAAGVYDQRVAIHTKDEIGALGENFNRMADAVEHHVRQLEEDARRQTMLLGALTHELKTPMTGIKGNAQTLLMTKLSEEEKQDALLYISEQCTRLERLSGKMMQLILLREQDSLVLTKCRVEDIFARVESACARQLKDRGVILVTDNRMDTVMAEPDLLVSMLLNLIDNAGKASGPGEQILLSAGENCIQVQDHGMGIPADQLDKITQPFYMVDKSRSRQEGSAGLGLALVSEIAALHHASLSIESRSGEGTTVKLQFAYSPMNT